MAYRWIIQPKGIITTWLFLTLAVIVACGGAAEAPAEKAAAPAQMAASEKKAEAPAQMAASEKNADAPAQMTAPEKNADAAKQMTAPKGAPKAIAPIRKPAAAAPTAAPAQSAAAPGAVPEASPPPALDSENFGGIINMSASNNPTKRSLYWGGSGLAGLGPAYNGLVEWNPEQPDTTVIRGDLADRWEVLDGGRTYIFHLNENARWHDGVPVTAADVVFSMDNMVCPNCFEISRGRPTTTGVTLIRGIYDAGSSRAIDDKTAEVELKTPDPFFLDMLSNNNAVMSPRHTVLDQGKLQEVYKSENLNGSGPFKRAEMNVDVSMVWEKNTDYWKEGYPRVDGMTHFIITEAGTLAAAFKTGQILMANYGTSTINTLQAVQLGEDMAGELTVHFAGPSGLRGLYVMVKKKPFEDQAVRKAVNLALHRQQINDILSGGRFMVGTPLPPGRWYSYTVEEAEQMPGFRELNGEKHPDDIAEARRLLAEAGYPSEGLQVELAFRDCCGYADYSALVADQLRNFLGWEVTLKAWEVAAGSQAQDAGNFQFWFQGTTYNLDTPSGALGRYEDTGPASRRSVGGNASSGWVPEGLNEVIKAIGGQPDPEKQKEMARQAHDIMLNQDTNYIGVVWTMRHWPVSNRIQNFHMHPSSYYQRKLEHIWCDPKC